MSQHLPYEGFKLESGGRTIILGPTALLRPGHAMSDLQLFRYAQRIAEYVNATGSTDKRGWKIRKPISFSTLTLPNNFKSKSSESFRKFVSAHTWDTYLSKGKFQIATSEYYRSTENTLIADENEGLYSLMLETPERDGLIFGRTGDNCLLFCGTGVDLANMTDEHVERFGNRMIEIRDVQGFSDRMSALVGARRVKIFDVNYSDTKMFRYATASPILNDLLSTTDENGSLTHTSLEVLENNFELLYEATLLPSLFMKPKTRYEIEAERRIAFELDSDPINPVRTFEAPELLDFISVTSL